MALNVHVATTRRNAIVDGFATPLNSGKLRIYDGTQAANANTAIGAQVLLCEFTFNATSFPAASAGSSTANSISNVAITAAGTATWSRWVQSDATTVVLDCSVGTSGSDINFNSVVFAAGATASMTSLTLSVAA